MRRLGVCIALLVCCLCFHIAVSEAQILNVDLSKIDPQLAAKILEAEQSRLEKKAKVEQPVITVDRAREWADVGENVAKAIAATAKALSIEVNEFINTPVGKWSFVLVLWYLVGKTIWTTIMGLLIWMVLGMVIWHSFKIFHLPKVVEVVDSDGKKQKSKIAYSFKSGDAKALSATVHVGLFIVLSVVMLTLIF